MATAGPTDAARFALVIENGARAGHTIPLTGSLTIGRGGGADLCLDDPHLSRRHARVDLLDGAPVLIDLQSTNGSYVNGQRVAEPLALWVGDRVQLGGTVFQLVAARAPAAGRPGPRPAESPWRWPWQTAPGEPWVGVAIRWLAAVGAALSALAAVGLLGVGLLLFAAVAAVPGSADMAPLLVFGAQVLGLLAFAHAYVAGRLRAGAARAHGVALGLAAWWLLVGFAVERAAELGAAALIWWTPPLAIGIALLWPPVGRYYRGGPPTPPFPPPAPPAAVVPPAAGPPLPAETLLRSGPFAVLPADWQAWFARQARAEQYAPGQIVVREGDRSDDLYVVASGQLEVVGRGLGHSELPLAQLGPGAVCGETAVLTGAPRTATIRATTPATVWRLPGAAVREALRALPRFREALRQRVDYLDLVGFLQRFSPFAGLPAPAVVAAARRCRRYQVPSGATVVAAGAVPSAWFLIKQGEAEARYPNGAVERLGPGDSFGASGAPVQPPSPVTVVARTPLELVALAREDLQRAAATYPRLRRLLATLLHTRFAGAAEQPLALPDPVSTLMPGLPGRTRGRYWLLLGGGIGLLGLLSLIAARTAAGWAVAATILVGAFLAPAVYLRYLWERDLLRSITPGRLVGIGLSGGVGAVLLALVLSDVFPTGVGALLPALGTGLVEETAKALSATWLMWRRRYRFELDGIVFGVGTGMAFAAVENVLYAVSALERGGVDHMLGVVWARGFTTFLGHGVWTGLVCAAIWRGKGAGGPRLDGAVLGAFATAVVLHALWDWSPLVFAIPVGVVGTLLLRYRVQQAVEAEQAAIAAVAVPARAGRGDGPPPTPGPCANCGAAVLPGTLYCARCGAAQWQRPPGG
jgi:CRP-like cAMP-binding protein/RsiW-degrading membrane proteinase PrsW (M82 family)